MRIALGTLLAALLLAGCGSGGGGGGSAARGRSSRRHRRRPRLGAAPGRDAEERRRLRARARRAEARSCRRITCRGSAISLPRATRSSTPPTRCSPVGRRQSPHILAGVRNGHARLGNPKLPLAGIGYSRGGRLVVEWAALQRPAPQGAPERVPVQINPLMEPPINLRKLDRHHAARSCSSATAIRRSGTAAQPRCSTGCSTSAFRSRTSTAPSCARPPISWPTISRR